MLPELFIAAATLATPAPIHTFENPSPYRKDIFGAELTVDDRYIYIAAASDDTLAKDAGATYAFDRATYELVQTYLGIEPGEFAGKHLASNGKQLLVGAWAASVNDVAAAGRAHVYDIDSGELLYSIDNPTPEEDERFGRWGAWTGSRWLVGAYKANDQTYIGGAAYLFDGNGQWVDSVFDPTAAELDRYGYSVAATGDMMFVAAYRDSEIGRNSGGVFVYDADGELIRKVLNPSPEDIVRGDFFGSSLDAKGKYVAVGSFANQVQEIEGGSAYIYDAVTGEQLLQVDNPHPQTDDRFGFKVAWVGDNLLVGSWDDPQDGGEATVFLFDGVTGALLESFSDPEGGTDSFFGFDIAAVGTDILIGGQGYDDRSGKAFLFDGSAYLPKPGDADHDGVVEGNDYLAWASNYESSLVRGPVDGDFNYDGITDSLDYLIWANNWEGDGPPPNPVPEPTALGTLLVSLAIMFVPARCRRR